MKNAINNRQDLELAASVALARANAEPSQGSYNAAWLHGYAAALQDLLRNGSAAHEEEAYAA